MKKEIKKSKKQNESFNNKGITLIALIITIIVMLILVAVTITMAVNGGLFEYARNAAVDTENEKNKELLLSQGIIGGKTINQIVAEYTNSGDETTGNNAITLSATNISYDDFFEQENGAFYMYALTVTVDEQYSNYSIIWGMDLPDNENLFFDERTGNYAAIECRDKIRYGDITITARIDGTDEFATCILDTSAGHTGPVDY